MRGQRHQPSWTARWVKTVAVLGMLALLCLPVIAKAQHVWPEIDFGQAPAGWVELGEADDGGYWAYNTTSSTGRTVGDSEEYVTTSAMVSVVFSEAWYLSSFDAQVVGDYQCEQPDGTSSTPYIQLSQVTFHGFPSTIVSAYCTTQGYVGDVTYDNPDMSGGATRMKRWTCLETTPGGPCTLINEQISASTTLASAELGENPERPYFDALVAEVDAWKERWVITAPGVASQPADPDPQSVIPDPQVVVPEPQIVVPDPPGNNGLRPAVIVAGVAAIAAVALGAAATGGVVIAVVRGLTKSKVPAAHPVGGGLHRGSVSLKPRLASGPSSVPPTPPQPAPGIYGSGTVQDPFRDKSAFKINPDGTISQYPENAQQPPSIYGRGTRDDPYRDHSPGVQSVTPAPALAVPQPVAVPPPQTQQKQIQQKATRKTYYLTASTQQMTLAGGEQQSLRVEALEAAAAMPPTPCAANLQLSVPPQSGLVVSPATGFSRIDAVVSADRSARAGNYVLQIHGTAPDCQPLQGAVSITVEARRYELHCDPQQLDLRPGEVREVEIRLERFLPNGMQETDQDSPVMLEALGAENPLLTDPQRGSGQFRVKLSVPRGATPKLYHLQIRALPPDAPDALEALISVRVLAPLSLVVAFQKPLWDPDTRVDLYALPEQDPQQLDQLAVHGGRLTVRAWGEYRGSAQTVRSNMPIKDGTCRLQRAGESLLGAWQASEYGYIIQVPPSSRNSAQQPAGQELAVDVPVAVQPQQSKLLDQLSKDAEKAGRLLASALNEQVERYILAYLDYISDTEARTLASRVVELSTWLYNTASFVRYSSESIAAFKLALSLHGMAYRRFFDALINFMLEVLFWLIERIAGKLWRAYINRGRGSVTEAIEVQVKQNVEEILEKEARSLTQQAQTLEQQLREAAQESADSQLVRQARESALAQAELQAQRAQQEIAEDQARLTAQRRILAQAEDEAAQQAARRQIEVLEERVRQLEGQVAQGALSRQTMVETINAMEADVQRRALEIRRLAGELQGARAQLATLEGMQQGVRSSSDLQQLNQALQNAKSGGTALDPQIQQTLDAFVNNHWKQLDGVLRYLEANRAQSADADALIARVRALQESLRRELGVEAIKMTQNDFLLKPELQQQIRELNEANARVSGTAPAAGAGAAPGPVYRAMPRSAYDDGILGWAFYKMDRALEWLYPLHDWARGYMPALSWTKDMVVWLLEALLEKLSEISNWCIKYAHHPEAVRSVIAQRLRGAGIDKAQVLGLPDAFFRFPWPALEALGRSLAPTGLTTGYTGRAPMLHSLKTGAEGGYQKERALQQSEAFQYFETTLVRALNHDFESAPHDPTRSVSRGQFGRLKAILQTMDEYIQGFSAAGAGGGEALTALPYRLWEAKEWTPQDLEALVEWVVWALQGLAILLGALGLISGVGAAGGAALLAGASLLSLVGAPLRVTVVALWTMPNILGFQFDVIVAHALLYDVLYDGLPETLDDMIVERYDAGISGGFSPYSP